MKEKIVAKKIVGTLSAEEYETLHESFVASPKKYTKPIRIYVDVDGVIMPLIYSQEALDKMDIQATIQVAETHGYYMPPINIVEGIFTYNKNVAEKLSEWSHRDDVDFIWLTSWRFNAPYALDKLMNIKSVGFLPWSQKMSDYTHSFKRVAIEDEQEVSPSKFVWLDDFANKQRYDEIPVFTEGYYDYKTIPDPNGKIDDFTGMVDEIVEELGFVVEEERIKPEQYLSITTKDTVGLSEENMAAVDAWLNMNSGNFNV